MIRVAILALLLVGCNQSIDRVKVNWAIETCADRGGVEYYAKYPTRVKCNDGFTLVYSTDTIYIQSEEALRKRRAGMDLTALPGGDDFD